MLKKIKIIYPIIFLIFCFSILTLSSTNSKQKQKIYTYNFTDISPLSNLVIPEKYQGFWNDILAAKKANKTSEEIVKMTKEKHGIGLNDFDSVLKELGITDKIMDFVKDCMLNKKPIFRLLFKGAATPPKGTAQYDDAVESILPAVFESIKEYKDRFLLKPILYAGGVLGDEPDYIRKIKLGEIHWCGGTIALGEMLVPATSAFDLPFLFDYEPDLYYDQYKYCQIDWMLDKIEPTVNRLMEKKGFVLLALMDGGSWQCLATNKAPILKAEDIEDYTFFMFPTSRIAGEINRALGFKKSLVCRIWDVPSVAATGMLDSIVCCWYWHIIIQTTPYYRYVTDYPIRGFLTATALVQKDMFTNMVECGYRFGPMMGMKKNDMLKIVRNFMTTASKSVKSVLRRNLRIKEGEARRMLIKEDIYKMVKFPKEELKKIKDKILPLYDKLADKRGKYPKWFLDELLKYREEYRKYKREGRLTDKWFVKGIYPDGYDEDKWTRTWKP